MHDFVGQKFLEFIFGQVVEMNLCQKKPGGQSVFQKAIWGKWEILGLQPLDADIIPPSNDN